MKYARIESNSLFEEFKFKGFNIIIGEEMLKEAQKIKDICKDYHDNVNAFYTEEEIKSLLKKNGYNETDHDYDCIIDIYGATLTTFDNKESSEDFFFPGDTRNIEYLK